MSSGQNSTNNDFNGNQMCKDCLDGLKSIIDRMTLFTKITIFASSFLYILNLFTQYTALYLVQIPYFTIYYFQLWRLFTTAFITTNIISLILSIFFWYKDAVKLENEKGTVKYMLNFFINCFCIQILHCLIIFIIYLIFRNENVLVYKISMDGVRNNGLWPILMCDLTIICMEHPEENLRVFLFPCVIKAKYYPLVLFLIITILSNFNIDFESLCGIAVGFLRHFYLRNSFEISNFFALKVENNCLCKWMKKRKGYISLTSTGAPDVPANLETMTKSQNSNNFTAFSGKGFTVGSSNSNTTRENVDYGNLSSDSRDEATLDDSQLELNNNTSV